jgi:hypothetical protein
VEVIPFIEDEVVVINILNFDLVITSTWINVIFDAFNQAISFPLIHFGYIVYLMIWVTFEPFQLQIHYDNTNKIPQIKISKISLEFWMYYYIWNNVAKQDIYYNTTTWIFNFLTKNVLKAKQAFLHEDVQNQIN